MKLIQYKNKDLRKKSAASIFCSVLHDFDMVSTPPLLKYTICIHKYIAWVWDICNNKTIANYLKEPVRINDTYNRTIREIQVVWLVELLQEKQDSKMATDWLWMYTLYLNFLLNSNRLLLHYIFLTWMRLKSPVYAECLQNLKLPLTNNTELSPNFMFHKTIIQSFIPSQPYEKWPASKLANTLTTCK